MLSILPRVIKYQNVIFPEIRDIYEQLTSEQHPHTLFIACIDSRVDPLQATNSYPGEMLVHRNTGNLVPPYDETVLSEVGATIEFAVKKIMVKHIIVCGHANCGAMQGLIDLSSLNKNNLNLTANWIETHAGSLLDTIPNPYDLNEVTQKNILLQIEHIKTYPFVAEKIKSGQLKIHGLYYQFDKGQFFFNYENDFIPANDALAIEINKIVKTIIYNYLQPWLDASTLEKFHEAENLFTRLKHNLSHIWSQIQSTVTEQLWFALQELYDSPENSEFKQLVSSFENIKLDSNYLQKRLNDSHGYHLFCSQTLRVGNGLFGKLATPSNLVNTAQVVAETRLVI